MSDGKRRNIRIKPTVDTDFHIDYGWWDKQDAELRTYLISLLPEEQRNTFQELADDEMIDYVDPETAEVRKVDPLQAAMRSLVEDVELAQTPLVDAVFRVFLMNGNTPLTPTQLAEHVGRPATTILRTLAGARVYRGIRPVVDG
jgi:hypothetical protein